MPKYLAAIAATAIVSAWPAGASAQAVIDRVQPERREPINPEPLEQPQQPRVEVQAEQAAGPSDGQEITIGAITLTGLQVLHPADFAAVFEPQLGQTLDSAGLRMLADAIVAEAQRRGFAFATAQIEPQRLAAGVLTIRVDEGRIDELRFDGPAGPAVRSALASLVNGRPVRLEDVERRLLIADDIDGVEIHSSRYVREGDHGVLLIGLGRQAVQGWVTLSNEGTRPLGPLQARLDLEVNGLLADGDQLSLSYTTTPFEIEELHFGQLRYAKRISASGTELVLLGSASQSSPGAYLEPFGLDSDSWHVGVGALQPLLRRREASIFFSGDLSLRNLRQRSFDIPLRDERLTTARATLHGYAWVGGGWLRSSVTLAQGLDIFGAIQPGDPLASRFDADGVFASISTWSDWTRGLGGGFSTRFAFMAQVASGPLPVTEEIGLGGTGFLRAYDWSERTGDEGAMGFAELRYDWKDAFGLIDAAQFYGFVDSGEVTNIDSSFGSGSLTSAGGGIRADLSDRLGATFEVAVPLSGARYDTGDEEPRVSFRVVRSF